MPEGFAGSLVLWCLFFYKSSNKKDLLVNPIAAGSGDETLSGPRDVMKGC